ncbi:hypothetical protein C8J56DRAFT_820143 [Mycena floridula]|nr:hypothetical protein C8J56DRAFT_820143 [Mycena floridula]
MVSSASTTGSESRSPSPPVTPESHSVDLKPRIHSAWSPKTNQEQPWEMEMGFPKSEDDNILRLDELLEQHVFEDSPSIVDSASRSLPLYTLSNGPVSLTKPVPPPASIRKLDSAASNVKVVKPPKESCFNLPIMFPGMSDGVTKSRVETQVRLTVDLADNSSSADPYKYDKVGSWKWLKLPEGTATKKKSRKQVKTEPAPEDILYLSTSVSCASPPHNPVLSCSSCQAREAKRVAKKIAARVKPPSDTDSGGEDGKSGKRWQHEDTTSIIQFNCSQSVDFSTGSVILPLRITCYCRHHREKLGFTVHFTMMDHNGRIVGSGSTKPIMITDDHKTNIKTSEFNASFTGMDVEWSQVGGSLETPPPNSGAPSKRKKDATMKTRGKPYDSGKTRSVVSRETSVSSPSPSNSSCMLPYTRSPTPPPSSAVPSLLPSSQDSESSSDGFSVNPFDISGLPSMMDTDFQPQLPTQPVSTLTHSMPFMFFDTVNTSQPTIPVPTIHRLIPNTGPTHGGIEVTVLGANFHPTMLLSCVFGGIKASSTQRWSDNALVCVLPPRATAGVVAVWFDGLYKSDEESPPTLFTYSDESDRALMELALQVVGLKMTGKIEDAKNVAMRIVGNAGDGSDSRHRSTTDGMMQMSSTRDLGPLLLFRGRESEDFESTIVKLLSVVDASVDSPGSISMSEAASHATASGQTLLHLAAFLGFSTVVQFLADHDVDLDNRDRNGLTALHFAVFSNSKECAKILLKAGADREVVNSAGKTPEEIASPGFLDGLIPSDEYPSDDEEAHWGDGEEDAQDNAPRRTSRTVSRRPSKRLLASRAITPPPPAAVPEKIPILDNADDKQHAWFVEMIQRTLAQLPGAQHLPLPDLKNLPQLPQLPEIPAVPWGALPQLPMVFPIFVPMIPGWPSFLGGDVKEGETDAREGMGAGAIKLAQEQWRNACEKWVALAARQHTEPPPMYTPRQEEQPSDPALEPASEPVVVAEEPVPADSRHVVRRTGYGVPPTVTHQEVDAFAYQPRPQQKKHDKMLIVFWIPILFVSLLWALTNGVVFAIQTIRTALPLNTGFN